MDAKSVVELLDRSRIIRFWYYWEKNECQIEYRKSKLEIIEPASQLLELKPLLEKYDFKYKYLGWCPAFGWQLSAVKFYGKIPRKCPAWFTSNTLAGIKHKLQFTIPELKMEAFSAIE